MELLEVSFLLKKDDGSIVIRNSRFLKHQWKNPQSHVSWTDPVSAELSGATRVADGAPSCNELPGYHSTQTQDLSLELAVISP